MTIDEARFRLTEERLRRARAQTVPADAAAKQRWKAARRGAGGALEALGDDALERVLGRDDLVDKTFFEAMAKAALAVCRVELTNGFGTGWLLNARLLITNHHVLPDATEAADAVVAFEVDAVGVTGKRFKLDPARLFKTSPQEALDYAVVAVAEADEPALAAFATTRVAAAYPAGIALGEPLNVIQHPNGEHKQYAVRENEVIAIDDRFVHYKTDTNPGSSGSPVFNNRWEAVALHHSGVPRKVNGVIMNRRGEPWRESQGDHAIDWIANEGVRIDAILKDLTQQVNATEKKLFGTLLEVPTVEERHVDLRATSDESAARDVTARTTGGQTVTTDAPANPAQGGAAVSFTIPLHVEIRVGEPAMASSDPRRAKT